jgi:hypothetical protein
LFVGQSLINARFDRTLKFTISTAVLLSLYELFRRKVAREVKV